MLREIREQPDALRRLVAREPAFSELATELRSRRVQLARLAAHGSSDNACSYATYAFGLLPQMTAFRDSLSLPIYHGVNTIGLSRPLVICVSQSGRTPDVVEYAQAVASYAAETVAITNDPSSPLADACEATLALEAGPELAVAATKTYMNTLAAFALLAAALAGRGPEFTDKLSETAALMEAMLPEMEQRVRELATSFSFVGRMFVVGRGLEYATARETALKLTETCRVVTQPYTATDLAHGPVAAVDVLFPVWAVASKDETLPATVEAVERSAAAGGTVIVVGNAAEDVPGAHVRLPVPAAPDPVLAPLLSVVPAQLFGWALAQAKGLDPDAPVNLRKVTEAS